MSDLDSLDHFIQDLATQIQHDPPPKAKAKKKVKKKKPKTTKNDENLSDLNTPDLPSDLEFSFDIFRPVLKEKNGRVPPTDNFQSLAVDDDMLAALKDLELSGKSPISANNSDDNLSDILADLDESPVTVKKCPVKKKNMKPRKSRKNILRPPLGSTSTPNNAEHLPIPKIQTDFHASPHLDAASPHLLISSAEVLVDSGPGSVDIFSSISEIPKTSNHDSGLKIIDSSTDFKDDSKIIGKRARSPVGIDLPDLTLGSLRSISSKPPSPAFWSTRNSGADDSYDLNIEMSRISKFSNNLDSNHAKLDDTEILESSNGVKFIGRANEVQTVKLLDDTEILESCGEKRISAGKTMKTKIEKPAQLDDTQILGISNDSDKAEKPVKPRLTRVGRSTSTDEEEICENDRCVQADFSRLSSEMDPKEDGLNVSANDRCIQADFSRLSSDSEEELNDEILENDVDDEIVMEREVQADFSRLTEISEEEESEVMLNVPKHHATRRTLSPEIKAATPEALALPHKLSFSDSPKIAPENFLSNLGPERTVQISSVDPEIITTESPIPRSIANDQNYRRKRNDSSSDDDAFEKFLSNVKKEENEEEEVEEEVEEDIDDFIVSDSEEVVCLSSDEDRESSDAECFINPYMTPPEFPTPSPDFSDDVTSLRSDVTSSRCDTPTEEAPPLDLKTPRDRVVRFSDSDSDDDELPDIAQSPRRPKSTTPPSVYKTARPPPRSKPRLPHSKPRLPGSKPRLPGSSQAVRRFSSDEDSDFEILEKPRPALAPPVRSNSTSNILSTPSAPVPASVRNRGGKTVSSIQIGKTLEGHHYDFLKSLGKEVPPQRIHPEALKYVRNFKHTKDELSQRLFRMFNEKVFDNKLRERVPVIWNKRLTKTAGYCVTGRDRRTGQHSARVELSTKVCDSAERVRDTLLHELCHAATWLIDLKRDGHGPYWKRWARIAHLSYPQLPMVTRCHSYYIETKYIYRCRKCGYSINRHSKSLNTEMKVCGYCQGEFDLYSRAKDGSLTLVAANQAKTPLNKFAQFVKENYGSVKSSAKSKRHKDVMQLLSAEFAAKNKIQSSI